MKLKAYIIVFIALLLLSCAEESEKAVRRTTISMGTMIEIQVADLDEKESNKAITAAFNEIERINRKYSTYIKNNLMWDINNSDKKVIDVDPETYDLLIICDELFHTTNEAFDPAIGNLIDLLGFETGYPDLPEPGTIVEALQNVGWKHVNIEEKNKLRRSRNVKLNFGAIAKGYAVDRASFILDSLGVKKYLVNAGGEVKGEGREWLVGIQHPRKKNELLGSIVLNGRGIATSGDYEQFFNKAGRRYTHIINPVTGYPARECMAVTVITADVTRADALATGIFVQSPQIGLEIIEGLKETECLIVDSSGVIIKSSGFDKFLRRH
ncbi:MAG: FAD:protein FMN transferase [Melioribacteraceae bacterium]|nr:FAD:protein FMN transferase [Melioribacteraceae bacterium]MCF8354832.1 FAD:protein FMN transferase [Melioribacteraceae bacterium]MCF8394537.1 FAD:protein FMN transferase [Melioribacteraceae bacterium]MCF8420196.1 FAD:protein FMN transferase [Melioribacteraceae bacterium]